MSKNNECFEIGLLAGVLGGFIAGLLVAPENGEKSRKKVRKAIESFNEAYDEDIVNAKKQIAESYDLLKYNIERQFRKLVHRIRARRLRKAKELESNIIFADMN